MYDYVIIGAGSAGCGGCRATGPWARGAACGGRLDHADDRQWQYECPYHHDCRESSGYDQGKEGGALAMPPLTHDVRYSRTYQQWASRIIPSLALRSFHQSALALQNGVLYVPARGHTREPAQQGCPGPRTSNDGRDARQLLLGLAQDRHLQLPDAPASLAQKLVGPQYYRTVGTARHDPRVALPWLRYGYQHGQQDLGERPDGELPSVHTLQEWAAWPSG